MNLDLCVPLKDQKEGHNFFAEIVNAEKQLWGLIHSKGILHKDVQDLHHKIRSDYEKTILNDHEVVELQDVEYSLWKLHYKHIDEFRKRMRKTSNNADGRKSENAHDIANVHNSFDSHVEGFRTFLSEATDFYQNLITKLKRCYGLLEEHKHYKKGGLSCSADSMKLHRCQYSCHRFLVCLGDLARYMELCKKHDSQNCNWSVAATYYFEAAMTCPDSGNPQNQLALLATYVSDDFLALYHCVRSLAVKEPFPDAWDNLILLFEKNRLQHLHSLSIEANIDFLNPSERSTSLTKLQSSCDSSNCKVLEVSKHDLGSKNDLWPLFVRMASFFFIKSSLEDFPCIFASTVRELEALLAVDDTELKDQLESYQHMDSTRTGPYRILQAACVLMFIIHSLNENQGINESKENNDFQKPILTQLAWTATLICMGRLLERCMKGDSPDPCPILPAVHVFLEWLVGSIDKAETYCADEKLTSAIAYFFDAFVDLLNRLCHKVELKSPHHAALWEDYELWGFAPIADAHMSLDFEAHSKCMGTFDSGSVCRAYRIFHAAMKIVERSKGSQRWLFYDKLGGKFYRTEPIKFPDQGEAEIAELISDLEVKEDHQRKCEMTKQYEKDALGTKQSQENGKSIAVEEEEVILFKPITRHNSAPIYTSITTNDQISTEGLQDETAPDECLRRASSLLIEQCQAQDDRTDFHSSITNFRYSKPLKQPEPLVKESATYPAGPPSLSAWVINRESLNIERERGTRDFSKHCLSPIQEQASASLTELSICQTEDYPLGSGQVSASTNYLSPTYSAPVPSAPLLPDDTNWYTGNSFGFSDFSPAATKETDGILGTPPLTGYTNWSAASGTFNLGARVPGLNDGYPPLGLTSSEWLRQYNNSQKFQRVNDYTQAAQFYAPESLGNFHGHDASRFNLLDHWGNPLAYTPQIAFLGGLQLHPAYPLMQGADEGRNEKLFVGYQRPNHSGCYPGMDARVEQPPVLQYLRGREWQLQQESQLRGPTRMGN